MRRLLLSSAALVAMSVAAAAADLPRRAPAVAPAPVYVAPIFTWSGFYMGVNLGVAFGNDNDRGLRAVALPGAGPGIVAAVDYVNAGLAAADRDNDRNTSLTGGVQIGYNWQFGGLVVGLEADINAKGRNGDRRDYTIVGTGQYAPYELDVFESRRGANWFGTIRPRIGMAFDRTLLYVTGGLAYGSGNRGTDSVVLYDTRFDPDREIATWTGSRRSGGNWGWTLGAGIEHAFSQNWTMKLEYLYVDLDRGRNRDLVSIRNDDSADVVFRGGRGGDSFHVVRAGLNFKFGGPAAGIATGPVVAAY